MPDDATAPPSELYRLDRELSRDELIAALASIPERVRALCARADAAMLMRRDGDAWTAMETLRHFRDIVQVYGVRFKWMILDDDPLLANYDEDAWAANATDGPGEVDALVREIEAYRGETVRLLRSLQDDGWARTGRHEALGRVVLEPYVQHELAHEEQHLAQLATALGVGAG